MIQVNNSIIPDYRERNTGYTVHNKTNHTNTARANSDTYTSTNHKAESKRTNTQNRNIKTLDSLSQKYDTKNLSTEDRTKLLVELKNAGLIDEKDFNVAKYTQIPLIKPDGSSSISYAPDAIGDTQLSKMDWQFNYQVIDKYLEGNSASDLDPQYKDTYSKLSEIMEQMELFHNGEAKTDAASEIADNQKGFTQDEIAFLSGKYNVKDMSREERNQLLKELCSKGVISEKEYSIASVGAVEDNPSDHLSELVDSHGNIYISGPVYSLGKNPLKLTDRDWIYNYGLYSKYLSQEVNNGNDIYTSSSNIYSKIYDIFKQIGDIREKDD